MTKVFAPAYDPATRDNATIARLVPAFSPIDVNLIGDAASANAFWSALKDGATTFVIMSHGDKDCVSESTTSNLITLQCVQQNKYDILNRVLFVFACKTAIKLGEEFRKAGVLKQKSGVWWGYNRSISAPEVSEKQNFVAIFDLIATELPMASTPEAAKCLVDIIKEMCLRYYKEVVSKMAGGRLPSRAQEMATLYRHLWEHLEVHFADGQWVRPYAEPPVRNLFVP